MNALDTIVLCGGHGTRLKPVVGDHPKCLADVNGEPFLSILENSLRAKGLRRFIYSCGHGAERVMEHLGIDKTEVWVGNRLVCRYRPDGTGAAVWTALDHIGSDPFIVVNGDTVCDFDLAEMVSCHVQSGSVASVALDRELRNCGTFVFSKEIFKFMAEMSEQFLLEEVFKEMGRRGVPAVTWHMVEEPFFDIGTPEGLERFRSSHGGRRTGAAGSKGA